MSEINAFFIVLFISQLLVGMWGFVLFFSCLSLVFDIVNLVIWSAESIPAWAFILNCFGALKIDLFLPLSLYKC